MQFNHTPQIDAALILCGGQSRRMRRDKATLPVGSEAMLTRVARLISATVSRVVVVAAQGQSLPPLPGSVVVIRDEAAEQGPLRGLGTGLAALPAGVDLVYLAATDGPLLQPGWLGLLASRLGDADAAVPVAQGHWHPLAALYRREPTLRLAQTLLGQGERRLMALVGGLAARPVTEADLRTVDPALLTLCNANHPDDYQAILAHLAGQ